MCIDRRRFAETMCSRASMDHERLTYRFNGRDYRLTDVYGDVVTEIIA